MVRPPRSGCSRARRSTACWSPSALGCLYAVHAWPSFEQAATVSLLPDQSTSSPPRQIQVAEEYVRRKVHLDRVPDLVQRGLEQAEDQEKYYRETEAFARMTRDYGRDDSVQRQAREILIRHAIVTQQKERALTLLSEFRRELDQSKPTERTGRAASAWQGKQTS